MPGSSDIQLRAATTDELQDMADEAATAAVQRVERAVKDLFRYEAEGMVSLRVFAETRLGGEVSVDTLRRWARDEGMPTHKAGRTRLIDPKEFDQWVRARED